MFVVSVADHECDALRVTHRDREGSIEDNYGCLRVFRGLRFFWPRLGTNSGKFQETTASQCGTILADHVPIFCPIDSFRPKWYEQIRTQKFDRGAFPIFCRHSQALAENYFRFPKVLRHFLFFLNRFQPKFGKLSRKYSITNMRRFQSTHRFGFPIGSL